MPETGKEGLPSEPNKNAEPFPRYARFPIALRVADMPEDLGKLLEVGIEEHFRVR